MIIIGNLITQKNVIKNIKKIFQCLQKDIETKIYNFDNSIKNDINNSNDSNEFQLKLIKALWNIFYERFEELKKNGFIDFILPIVSDKKIGRKG